MIPQSINRGALVDLLLDKLFIHSDLGEQISDEFHEKRKIFKLVSQKIYLEEDFETPNSMKRAVKLEYQCLKLLTFLATVSKR